MVKAIICVVLFVAAITVVTTIRIHKHNVEAEANWYDRVEFTKKGVVAYIRDNYPSCQHPCLYPLYDDMISELPNIDRLAIAEMHPDRGETTDYPTHIARVKWINLWQYTSVEYPVVRVVLRDIDDRRTLDCWEKRQDGSWHQAKDW